MVVTINMKTLKKIARYFIYVIIVVCIWWLSRNVYMLSIIPTESMYPTIKAGQMVYGNRLVTEFNRYDVVVFKPENKDVLFIKRIIGLPGETIVIKNKEVYVNNKKVKSDYIKEEMNECENKTFVIPKGCYFLMGDNRNNSFDSRYWENPYLPEENIEAKALFTFFPFKKL